MWVANLVPGYFSSNRALKPGSARLLSVYQAPSNSSGAGALERQFPLAPRGVDHQNGNPELFSQGEKP